MNDAMNPYQQFVAEQARLYQQAKSFQLGGFAPLPKPALAPDAPKVLLFSPHPDDEVIVGGLPLRLLRELHWNVIDVAVTQGSNKARQHERLKELAACCQYIGFGLIQTREYGLENINPKTRLQYPAIWNAAVDRIVEILTKYKPHVIFFPHEKDWNSTHIGTHFLLVDALARLGGSLDCYVVETEYWAPMEHPNLMVESSPQDVTDLLTAITFHVGEVQRNPYHLRLPAWLMDNVRRGGELVGGQGAAAPDFTFATLYRLRRWHGGKLEQVLEKGRFVSCTDPLAPLFL
jgi:LmbE family N-acetylglucosaminyl deacetylase